MAKIIQKTLTFPYSFRNKVQRGLRIVTETFPVMVTAICSYDPTLPAPDCYDAEITAVESEYRDITDIVFFFSHVFKLELVQAACEEMNVRCNAQMIKVVEALETAESEPNRRTAVTIFDSIPNCMQ